MYLLAIEALSADGDTISRQAAIDIERNATVDTNPSHFESHQKFTQFMDDAEISSFGRWQWSNGFNTALTAVGIDLKKLPSAQPKRKNDIIQKFHDYQIEWLKSHYDIELEPQLEEMIVRFLHDTANCYMMEAKHDNQ